MGDQRHPRSVEARLRRRVLVNALVDPDEAASRLPPGLRPHVTGAGTIVGCCLVEIEAARPAGWPAWPGVTMLAAAHRIAAEWTDATGETHVGVHVPMRHTSARLAVALGGRWFPGVHQRADVRLRATDRHIVWESTPRSDVGFAIRVDATTSDRPLPGPATEPTGATCLGATLGVSPGRDGSLEVARMEPSHRAAETVAVDLLASPFVDGFRSRRTAPSYLVRDVAVSWSRATDDLLPAGAGATVG